MYTGSQECRHSDQICPTVLCALYFSCLTHQFRELLSLYQRGRLFYRTGDAPQNAIELTGLYVLFSVWAKLCERPLVVLQVA